MRFYLAVLFASLFSISLSASVYAQGLQSLVRQPRTMAMGGAGVGLADDEYALFQNPAGLAGSDQREFKILGLSTEVSWDAIDVVGTSLDAFRNFHLDDLNKLMGKDVAMRLGMTPMIRLPGFAVSYVVDVQGSINQFNQANPYFDLGFMTTHGVQAGMGWSVKNGKRATDEWRYGVAAKILWRRGGLYSVSTTGFLQATNDGKAYIDNLVGQFGTGFGADVGTQYVNHIDKQTSVSFGASITDLGDTKFSDPHATKINMSMNLGLGFKRDLGFMKFAIAADLRHLNERTSFSNKTHLGGELSIPAFDFYFGINQLNPTYGVAFDIWVLRLSLISYAEELGIIHGQNTTRKTLLQADFSLPI